MRKVLTIPYIPELDVSDISDLGAIFDEKAVRQSIDYLNWPTRFPYKPITIVDIARGAHDLYIRYFVRGNCLRAVTMNDQGPVKDDSCVSFLVKETDGNQVFAFEFNCIGVCAASIHSNEGVRNYVDLEQMKRIRRFAEIGNRPFYEMEGLFSWELTVAIPFDLMGIKTEDLPEMLEVNFCKRADATSLPHYLSWNPIYSDDPDFYLPEYLGVLKLK